MLKLCVTRRQHIFATHRLEAGVAEELKEQHHGHEFVVDITLKLDSIEPEESYLSAAQIQSARQSLEALADQVVAPLSGQDLNTILPLSTGEALITHLYQQVLAAPHGPYLERLHIIETAKNRFLIEE